MVTGADQSLESDAARLKTEGAQTVLSTSRYGVLPISGRSSTSRIRWLWALDRVRLNGDPGFLRIFVTPDFQ
jgi:hypothetical protein